MSNKIILEKKIYALCIGKSFTVDTNLERQAALKTAVTLKRLGLIDFTLTTRETEDGKYKIAAI